MCNLVVDDHGGYDDDDNFNDVSRVPFVIICSQSSVNVIFIRFVNSNHYVHSFTLDSTIQFLTLSLRM